MKITRIPYPFVLIVLVASFLVPSPHPSHTQSFEDRITAIAWNPAGTLLAVARYGGELEIRDGNSGTLIYTDTTRQGIKTLAWSPDNIHLAVAQGNINSHAAELGIFNTQLAATIMRGEVFYPIQALAWSPDGTKIAAVLSDGVHQAADPTLLYLWNVTDSRLTYFQAFEIDAWSLAWHPSAAQLAITDRYGGVSLYELASEQFYHLSSQAENLLANVVWTQNKQLVAHDAYHIYHWDVATGQLIATLDSKTFLLHLALSPDASYLATDHSSGLALWHLDSAQVLTTIPTPHPITALAWHPDGSQFAYAVDDALYLVETSSVLPQTDMNSLIP